MISNPLWVQMMKDEESAFLCETLGNPPLPIPYEDIIQIHKMLGNFLSSYSKVKYEVYRQSIITSFNTPRELTQEEIDRREKEKQASINKRRQKFIMNGLEIPTNEEIKIFSIVDKNQIYRIDKKTLLTLVNQIDVNDIEYPLIVYIYKNNMIHEIKSCDKKLGSFIQRCYDKENFDGFSFKHIKESKIQNIKVEIIRKMLPKKSNMHSLINNSKYKTIKAIRDYYIKDFRINLRDVKKIIYDYNVDLFTLADGNVAVNRFDFEKKLGEFIKEDKRFKKIYLNKK